MKFWSADDFFVEATKLKVSLNDPPIFMTFLIGKSSGDGRTMIDIYGTVCLHNYVICIHDFLSATGRPIIGRSLDPKMSPDCHPIFGRWTAADLEMNQIFLKGDRWDIFLM